MILHSCAGTLLPGSEGRTSREVGPGRTVVPGALISGHPNNPTIIVMNPVVIWGTVIVILLFSSVVRLAKASVNTVLIFGNKKLCGAGMMVGVMQIRTLCVVAKCAQVQRKIYLLTKIYFQHP